MNRARVFGMVRAVGLAALAAATWVVVLVQPAGATGTTLPNIHLSCALGPWKVGATYGCGYSIDNGPQDGTDIVLSVVASPGGGQGVFTSGPCTLQDGACGFVFAPTVAPTAATFNLPGTIELQAYFPGDDNLAPATTDFGESVLQSTTSSVTCTPASIPAGSSSSCTLVVGGSALTSDMGFAPPDNGVLSPPAGVCTPTPVFDGLACTATYTPTGPGSSTREDEIQGGYDGYSDDPINASSQGSTDVAVTAATGSAATGTAVSCSPNAVTVGVSSTCTVAVGSAGGTPDGSVDLATSGTGVFSPSSCTLSGAAPPGDTCQVTYTPSGFGSSTRADTITASYLGNPSFEASQGITAVAVPIASGGGPAGGGGSGVGGGASGSGGVSAPDGKGYWMVAADGGVFAYGDAGFYGSVAGTGLAEPVVGLAATPDGEGYWEVASDGGVFAYGDAGFYGSAAGTGMAKPVVGIARTPDGKGYWLVAADGGVFAYGDAGFYGSVAGTSLAEPVVGLAATPDGEGYWEVASDGGVFAYGDAGFYGSAAGTGMAKPVVGIARTPDGKGYWLVAADGGVFAYGDAGFYGSVAGTSLAEPVVGLAATPDGEGYWEVAADGGVFAYGDAGFYGSAAGTLTAPIVGLGVA